MTARASMIQAWIERGQERGASYMITWYDPLDHEDYPTFHDTTEEVQNCRDDVTDQSIDEIYDLTGDISTQLSERRTFAI